MPDFGAPAQPNYQPPSFTQTLSGLIGLKQQQQALQLQSQAIEGGAADVQAKTQAMQERQRVTQMMSSGLDDQGNSIRSANGEFDPAKLLPALGRVAPYTGQQYAQSVLQTHTARVSLQAQSLALDADQRKALQGPIEAIATNPDDPSVVNTARSSISSLVERHPEMAGVGRDANFLLDHVEKAPPEMRAKMAGSMAAMLQGGQTVQTQPQSASVNDGQTTQIGASAPPVAGGGFTPATMVTNQPPPTTPTFKDGVPGILGANPPPGFIQTGPRLGQVDLNTETQAAASAASQAGGLHSINNEIYDLTKQTNVTTGWGKVGSKIRSAVGINPLPGDAENTDTLTKLLAQQNMRLAQQMGVHTDAGSAQVAQASGEQHYDPGALRRVTNINDGMAHGIQLYARGMLNANQTGDPNAAADFKIKFGQTFDADSAAFMAIVDSGNKGRLDDFLKDHGGRGSPTMASLLQKAQAMRKLAGVQ